MLEEFDKIIGIDKIGCIHVNDSKNDIKAGKTAGCKTVLVDYVQQDELQNYGQDDTVYTLEEFVQKYIDFKFETNM